MRGYPAIDFTTTIYNSHSKKTTNPDTILILKNFFLFRIPRHHRFSSFLWQSKYKRIAQKVVRKFPRRCRQKRRMFGGEEGGARAMMIQGNIYNITFRDSEDLLEVAFQPVLSALLTVIFAIRG